MVRPRREGLVAYAARTVRACVVHAGTRHWPEPGGYSHQDFFRENIFKAKASPLHRSLHARMLCFVCRMLRVFFRMLMLYGVHWTLCVHHILKAPLSIAAVNFRRKLLIVSGHCRLRSSSSPHGKLPVACRA